MNTYYDNVNHEIFQEIRPDAKSICEFGCGAGGLARAIRAVNPGVHYVGLELMPDQLQIARSSLDIALQRNLDRLPEDWKEDPELFDALPEASFDHVIFGDVLEHLYAPEALVKRAARLLRQGGTMVSCIPNVQHWTVFAQLVAGSWPQNDAGLFDRTHIRWFTLADMIAMMERSGQTLEKVTPRIYPHPQAEEIIEYLEPLAMHLNVDYQQVAQRAAPLQYVLTTRPVI